MTDRGETDIEREIAEQPRVLEGTLSRVLPIVADLVPLVPPTRVHLVGCGDMFFAAQAVAWSARLDLGFEAHAWRSMDLRWAAATLDPADLVVCASVSGRTPRTIEAARAARRRGARVVGITDNRDAPLADEVDTLIVLGTSPSGALAAGRYPGYHRQIAQTKTYTAVLLAESITVDHVAGVGPERLADVPRSVAAVLPTLSSSIRDGAGEWFAGRRQVALLASGPHLATARYGAAKFLEYAIPSYAQCLEEFNHLEAFLADAGTLAVVLAPDEASMSRARELLEPWERLGSRTVVIGRPAPYRGEHTALVPLEGNGHVLPFVQATALQLLAARGAVALGRDPDRWLGGVRTELMIELSRETVRGSRIV